MNFVKLQKEKLDVNAINDLVAHESCGAISLFVGTTRDNFENKKVVSLEYEAFDSMAEKRMTAVCEEVRTKWPDVKNIAIYHRLGNVPVKEASVVIAISSPHREASLLGVQQAIESLKKSVPIWKKELYEGDDSAWKENKESTATAVVRKIMRPKLNLEDCSVEAVPFSKSLVQIMADDTEVMRRINCFVEKKREEIDSQNVTCFTDKHSVADGQQEVEDSCARVNTTIFKQKDSNGHLRVRRVKNEIGPQIKPDYASTLNKLMGNITSSIKANIKQEPVEEETYSESHGLEERLQNVEKFLGQKNKPAPRDIYERLKIVEDRLLYLESISPEYYHFLAEKPPEEIVKKKRKPSYSIEDLDRYIADIQQSI